MSEQHGKGLAMMRDTGTGELTTTEAARQLGVSRATLVRMIRQGQVPARRVGSHYRLRGADVAVAFGRRRDRQRQALAELMALSDEIGDT